MLKNTVLTLLIVVCAFVAQANAQNTSSPEKLNAIKELVALVNVSNNAEEMVGLFNTQMNMTRAAVLDSLLNERTDLTEADKKWLREELTRKSEEFGKRFQEKLMQRLNYNKMINEISVAVYDKYFTHDEIKDLIAFYKTPTGQKALKTMTPLMADTMQMVSERMLTKLPGIMQELEREEKAEIEKEINTRKPRPKKPNDE